MSGIYWKEAPTCWHPIWSGDSSPITKQTPRFKVEMLFDYPNKSCLEVWGLFGASFFYFFFFINHHLIHNSRHFTAWHQRRLLGILGNAHNMFLMYLFLSSVKKLNKHRLLRLSAVQIQNYTQDHKCCPKYLKYPAKCVSRPASQLKPDQVHTPEII